MSNIQENGKQIPVQIINAFVKDGSGGNPAGVVLDADRFSDDEMLHIAQQVGLSETAFVSESETEGFKLDFFTPNRRIAHCGHATVATFSYLSSIGLAYEGETSKETVDGSRKIILKDGAAFMEQLAPKYRYAENWENDGVAMQDVLSSLGLTLKDLDPRLDPVLVNTGNNFIVVAVKNQTVLRNLNIDLKKIEEISEKLDLIGYYVFSAQGTEFEATTRMFGPRYGITEEAGTGMAAGPLACVLYDFLGVKKEVLKIEQGVFMDPPSPSLITVELDVQGGQIQGLMAGGMGKVMKEFSVTLP